MTLSVFLPLLSCQLRMLKNSFFHPDPAMRRFRNAMFLLGGVVFFLILVASYRIFHHLLYGLEAAPELGLPLVLRLVEMAHLLFFIMLVISSLTVSLSVFYLDPEIHFLSTTPLPETVIFLERILAAIIRSCWFVLFAAVALFLGYFLAAAPGFSPEGFLRSLVVTLLFVVPPTCLGILGSILIVRFFPVRRAKTVLSVLTVLSLCVIIVGLRGLTPERFLNPRVDPDLGLVLSAIAEPAAPWMPSGWVATAVVLGKTLPILLLALLALSSLLITASALLLWHRPGLARVSTERAPEVSPFPLPPFLDPTRLLPEQYRFLIRKDLKTFWRDPTQWSQLIVLLALIVIYVFNFYQFRAEQLSVYLAQSLAFINLGMAGFVLVAVANRFVFSAIALEGESIWLIKSSPYPIASLLPAKALFAFFPLLVLAEVITYFSNLAIRAPISFSLASLGVVAVMTAVLTMMGVSLGALAPRFDLSDPARIGMTPAGILYMGLGILYVLLFVALLALHIFFVLREHAFGAAPGLFWYLFPMSAAVLLNLVACLLPWSVGRRRMDTLQIP